MAKLLDKKFIGNDQVDGDKLKLLVGQTIRKDDGAGGSVDVLATIDASIASVQTNVDSEESARISGDAASVTSANSYTDGEVSAEAALRVSGDAASVVSANAYTDAQIVLAQGDLSVVEAAIAQEIIDRAAADALLQTQIDNVLSNVDGAALDSLTEIVSAFQAADSSLNGAITTLSTGLSADIDAEESARIAADTALQGEIDAEEVARAAADVTLQTNIGSEASARIAADSALQSEIDAEEVARAAADTTLQSNINSEAATRLAADNALSARTDILESVTWKKQKFAMSNNQISISLAFTPIAGSMSIFVDQVPMHESVDSGASDDFSVSGSSVSFINDFSSTGNKKMQTNDTVYVKYQYKA